MGDIGRCWEVRCTALGARVRAGATRRRPDVVIGTDAATWCALRAGELSGLEAFSQRRLYARAVRRPQGCGHVPQVERPQQTNGLLERFFARVDALGGPAAWLRAA